MRSRVGHVSVLVIAAAVVLGTYAHPARGGLCAPAGPAASTTIVISEVESDPVTAGTDSSEEWIELRNVSESAISLVGWTITDSSGESDTLPNVTVPALGCIIVAADADAFLASHPGFGGTVVDVAGSTLGNGLANAGDSVRLQDASSTAIDCVSYGSDTTCLSPSVPATTSNTTATIQRMSDVDTDTAADWTTAVETPCPSPPTAVTAWRFTSKRSSGDVILRWQSASEAEMLGFNVYRQQRDKLVKVNRTLISSVFGGRASGHRYSWLDRRAPRTGSVRYRLQAVSLSGKRSWLGAATAS